MRVFSLLVVAVLAVGCDRGASKANAPACEDDTAAILKAHGLPKDKETPTVHGQLTAACKDDHWTAEARACFAQATTPHAINECSYKTLTQEQSDKLAKAMPSSFDTEEAIRKMGEFTDKMCACHDAKCAQDVSDEMTKWAQEMAKRQREPPKMTEQDTKRATDIGVRMGECMQKAMGVGEGRDDQLLEHRGSNGGAM